MLGRRRFRGARKEKLNNIMTATTKEEIEIALKIINKSFSTVAKDFGFTKDNTPLFPAFITNEILGNQIVNGLRLFLYQESEKLVGCIGIKQPGIKNYKIERLAVLPEFRHKKIGYQLMKYAIEKIKEEKGKTVEVEIVNENTILKEWYKKLGFIEKRIDHYDGLLFSVGVLEKEV